MNEISVLGIFVADISFSGSKIPAIGETILGTKYNIGPGGKGCNQAIAVARLGGKVSSQLFTCGSFKGTKYIKVYPLRFPCSSPFSI